MSKLVVSLAIPSEEYIRIYKGTAKTILATTEDGRRVQFPATILQPYVSRAGVYGRFLIEFDSNNRFRSIKQL